MSMSPVCTYAIGVREDPSFLQPGTLFCPIVNLDDLIKKTPFGGIGCFNWACELVDSIQRAAYVVVPDYYALPPGFQKIAGRENQTEEGWLTNVQQLSPAMCVPCVPERKELCPYTPKESVSILPEGFHDTKLSLIHTDSGYDILDASSNCRIQATNYTIAEVSMVHHVRADGTPEEKFVRLRLHISAGWMDPVDLDIPVADIDQAAVRIGKAFGEAILFPPAKQAFGGLLAVHIRERIAGCRHQYVYEFSGWVKTKQGLWVYVEDDTKPPNRDITFRASFTFGRPKESYHTDWLVRNAWRLPSMSREPAPAMVPFIFTHLSLLWSLFEEAGYPPHALLFIKGTTGSLKTAFASLLFNFSGERANNIPATFRDTSASMEVKMSKYKDRVLLVDDFCPAASEASRRVLDQTLEQLVRFYGDGIARARTNSAVKETFERRPHGLCAITGEDSAGSYSSLLRCLFINVEPDTYSKELLAEFQAEPTLWTNYLVCFVESCTKHAEQIIAYVKEQFPTLRAEYSQVISERRLVDAGVCLTLAARVALTFAAGYLEMTEEKAEQTFGEFRGVIVETCRLSAEESKAADPVKIFARTLFESIDRQAVRVASKEEFAAAPDEFIGFNDGEYWFFWSGKLFQHVRMEYQMQGKTFPLTQGRLWEALYINHVLIPARTREASGGKFEYSVRVGFGNRPHMVRIDPAALRNYL